MSKVTAALKPLIRRGLAGLLHATGAPLKRLGGKVCILTYHRVLREEELRAPLVQPGMYVVDEVFDKQIGYLKKHFQIVSFPELLRIWDVQSGDRNTRYCVITFDDGWLDNYRNAFPILKEHGAPATIFLTTSVVGTGQMFWPERLGFLLERGIPPAGVLSMQSLKGNAVNAVSDEVQSILRRLKPIVDVGLLDDAVERLKHYPEDAIEHVLDLIEQEVGKTPLGARVFLGWEEIREMSRQGITFGSHCRRHRILTHLERCEVEEELAVSWCMLREQQVAMTPVLAYPNGDFTPEVSRIAETVGYRAAVTTRFGHEGLMPGDRYGLMRIGIHNDISSTLPLFAMRLSGIFRKQ